MKKQFILIMSLVLFGSTSLAAASSDDLLNKLRKEFSCDKNYTDFCMDNEEGHYTESFTHNLENGYTYITIFDQRASGTMSIYESFLQDKDNKFYYLGATSSTCVDSKNLLLFSSGHCSADENSINVSKIDLKTKKLITLKSLSCITSKVRAKYMQDNYPQSVSYNHDEKCDFLYQYDE